MDSPEQHSKITTQKDKVKMNNAICASYEKCQVFHKWTSRNYYQTTRFKELHFVGKKWPACDVYCIL